MWYTRKIYIFFCSSTEHCAWAIISPKEFMIGNHRTKTFLHEVMIDNHRNKTTES
jgi:hypothetical protein